MEREIIHVQIGGYGNKTSPKYWENMANAYNLSELLISEEDIPRINTYFRESETLKDHYVPRGIIIDFDSSGIRESLDSNFGHNYSEDNIFCYDNCGLGMFATGYYGEGADKIEDILEIFRKEIEKTENIQGIELNLNIYGGTGSGFGSLLMEKLKDLYPRLKQSIFCSIASNKYDNITHYITPYNALLCLQRITEFSNLVYLIDNEAIGDMLTRVEGIEKDNEFFQNKMNNLIAAVMENITSTFRFSSKANNNIDDICYNLVPWPRPKYLTIGVNSGIVREKGFYKHLSREEIYREVFDNKHAIARYDLRNGKMVAGYCTIKGQSKDFNPGDSYLSVAAFNSSYFHENFPNSYKLNFCDTPTTPNSFKASYLLNTSACSGLFQYMGDEFTKLFRRKAGIWEFLQMGMDEMEFTEAESNVYDLLSEYQGVNQSYGADVSDEEEDDEIN